MDIHRTQERLKLTGGICSQYAYFDCLISKVIWNLLNIDKDVGVIITGSLDIRPKIDMAIELAELKDQVPEIRAKLQSIKNSASKSNGFISKRNVIVHGIFSSRDGDPAVMVECHRKKALRGRQEIKVSSYEETHNEIDAANRSLCSLMGAAGINVH